MSLAQYRDVKQRLQEDLADASVVEITPSVIQTAVGLLENSRLRTLDALHIACALEWEADLCVSADKRQIEAARQAGLKIQSI